jgi:hypothetical protein
LHTTLKEIPLRKFSLFVVSIYGNNTPLKTTPVPSGAGLTLGIRMNFIGQGLMLTIRSADEQ